MNTLQTVDGESLKSVDTLLERFRAGQRGALARLVTFIENANPKADELLDNLYKLTGSARVIGVTGPPGSGKSTLTNALIGAFRKRGQTVGVIAIDPTSALSGGSTLGDRIRMLETYDDNGVYIRSMATRGQSGGLSYATGCVVRIFDAFGFDVIILETVGVGQDEIAVTGMADTTLLLQIPGTGDGVQTIKAGILEVIDIIVVNKSDRPGAREIVRDLRAMLRFRDHPEWVPPVVETVATSGEGIENLLSHIDRHAAFLTDSGELLARSQRRAVAEIRMTVARNLMTKVDRALKSTGGENLVADVVARRLTPTEAASELIRTLGLPDD